ncbi:MAG: hypothetical protein NT157_06095 [Candidatus Micrarchaeota archaeon]|nr:hypothetical protein [Candidatus Micrarchaeota archaeon]
MKSAHVTQAAKPQKLRPGEFLREKLMETGRRIKHNKLPIAVGVATSVAVFTLLANVAPSKTESFETFVKKYSVKNLSGDEIREILGPDWRTLVVRTLGEKEYAFVADWQTLNSFDMTIVERGLGVGRMCTPVGCSDRMFSDTSVTFVVPLNIKAVKSEEKSFTVIVAREDTISGQVSTGNASGDGHGMASCEVKLAFGGPNARPVAISAINAAKKNGWAVKSSDSAPAAADSGYVSVGEAPDFKFSIKDSRFGFLNGFISVVLGVYGSALTAFGRGGWRKPKKAEF